MCVFSYSSSQDICQFDPLCAPLTHHAVYPKMFVYIYWLNWWGFVGGGGGGCWIVLAQGGYCNLNFLTLLIEKVARLIDARIFLFVMF